MRNTLIVIAIIGILGLFVVTCPNREDHKTAITTALRGAFNEEISSKAEESEVGSGVAFLGSLIIKNLADVFIEQVLDYKNYFIYSTTEATFDGKEMTISYGFLGHVFTVDKEEIKRRIESADD